MEAIVERVGGIGHSFTIGRVMLPGAVGVRQALAADFIKVLSCRFNLSMQHPFQLSLSVF